MAAAAAAKARTAWTVVREVKWGPFMATSNSFKYQTCKQTHLPIYEDMGSQALTSSCLWLVARKSYQSSQSRVVQRFLTALYTPFFFFCLMHIGSLLQFPSLMHYSGLIPDVPLSPLHSSSHLPFPSASSPSLLFTCALSLLNQFHHYSLKE